MIEESLKQNMLLLNNEKYNYCYKTRVNVFAFHLLDKGKCMIIFTRTNFGAEAQLSFC